MVSYKPCYQQPLFFPLSLILMDGTLGVLSGRAAFKRETKCSRNEWKLSLNFILSYNQLLLFPLLCFYDVYQSEMLCPGFCQEKMHHFPIIGLEWRVLNQVKITVS